MMKNRSKLAEKMMLNLGIPLLVLLFTLLLVPKVSAASGEKQPNGDIVTVSGYVVCRGDRIADVSVEATTTGEVVLSDAEGKFTIDTERGDIITFRKAGYKAYEYLADESESRLILCLQSEDVSDDKSEEAGCEKERSEERVINIVTKKEKKEE